MLLAIRDTDVSPFALLKADEPPVGPHMRRTAPAVRH